MSSIVDELTPMIEMMVREQLARFQMDLQIGKNLTSQQISSIKDMQDIMFRLEARENSLQNKAMKELDHLSVDDLIDQVKEQIKERVNSK